MQFVMSQDKTSITPPEAGLQQHDHSINLKFYAFKTTYVSSLGQQHFSIIVALLQPVILIIFGNFNASKVKQMHKTLTHKTNNVSGRGIFALYPTALVLCDY